jgi:hypothetical protein
MKQPAEGTLPSTAAAAALLSERPTSSAYQPRYHSRPGSVRERPRRSRQRREGPSAERERSRRRPTHASSLQREIKAGFRAAADRSESASLIATTPSPTWQRRSSSRTRRTETSAADDETGDVTLLSTARHHLNRTRPAGCEVLRECPALLRTSTELYDGPAGVVAARTSGRNAAAGRATAAGEPGSRTDSAPLQARSSLR